MASNNSISELRGELRDVRTEMSKSLDKVYTKIEASHESLSAKISSVDRELVRVTERSSIRDNALDELSKYVTSMPSASQVKWLVRMSGALMLLFTASALAVIFK